MVPQMLLDRCGPHARHVDVPAVYEMPTRRIHGESLLVGLPIDDLHFCEANPLLVAGRSGDTRHHHELDQLVRFQGQLSALRLFEPVF
jgi:hypothetical protein